MVSTRLGPGIFTTPPCQEQHKANMHFQWEEPLLSSAASNVQTQRRATLTPACFLYLSI